MKMSPSRRSSVSSSSSEATRPNSCDNGPENRYYDYVVYKLNSYGSLPLQHLINQLSALPHNVQLAVGTSKLALCAFLEKYPDVFNIDSKGNVSLLKQVEAKRYSRPKRDSSCDSSLSSRSHLPEEIKDGRGVIIRIFTTYGFMKIIKPRKSSLYFSGANFGKREQILMSDHNLRVGQILGFDAVLGPSKCEAPYRATKVWCVADENDSDSQTENSSYKNVHKRSSGYERSNGSPAHVNKPSSSKECDVPAKSIVFENSSRASKSASNPPVKNAAAKANDASSNPSASDGSCEDYISEGIVQNIFDTHGFLNITNDPDQRVFFHANRIVDSDKISNLSRVLQKGDRVWFEAITSSKPSKTTKWEATRVWLSEPRKRSPARSGTKSHSQSRSAKTPIQSSQSKVVSIKSNGTVAKQNIGHSKASLDKGRIIDANATQLTDELGKIFFPPSRDVFVKFGPSYSCKAIVDISAVYMNGTVVEDITWQLSDDDNVVFDAVRIKENPGWKTTLVYIGIRPKITEPPTAEKSEEPSSSVLPEVAKAVFTSSPKHFNWADSPYPGDEEEENEDTSNLAKTDPEIVEEEETVEVAIGNSEDYEVYISDESDAEEHCNVNDNQVSHTNHFDSDSEHEASELCSGHDSVVTCIENGNNSDEEYQECNDINNDEKMENVAYPDKSLSPELASSQDDKPVVPEKEPPGVFMFDGTTAEVTKVHRCYVSVKCPEVEKAIIFFRTDFYSDGVLVSENHTHISEVLSDGDLVHLNYFKIIDDQGHTWQKATLVWIGQKPKDVVDMEPKEFIDTQNLSVSCDIPTWKSFRQKNKSKKLKGTAKAVQSPDYSNESMELLNNLSSPPSAGPLLCNDAQAARNTLEASTMSSRLYEKILDASDSFLAKVQQLMQQAKQKELRKGLQGLQSDIQSRLDAILIEISQSVPESDSTARSRGDISEARMSSPRRSPRQKKQLSVASQTVITGEVVSHRVFPM